MEVALVERLGKALGLPRPHMQEENRAFTVLEGWQQLTVQVMTQTIQMKPLGYYRTPDGVDIYVLECSMGKTEEDKKCWKIYRRYRQFHNYVTQSSDLLSSMVVPRLSQAYMKIFHAKHCKDRLVELHAWLVGVIENTQKFYQERLKQPNTFLHQMDTTEAMPAIMLSSFLFAGANNPFPHYFRGMPAFAFALEEVNIQLTKAPVYPSKLRSSLGTTAGLGLRLTASHEQEGKFIGATVSGFLRDASELDSSLARVQVGSKLVRINGVDITDEAFDKILSHLRAVGLPLRLRFLYNPHLHRRSRAKSAQTQESTSERGSFTTSNNGSPRSIVSLEHKGSIASAASSSSSSSIRTAKNSVAGGDKGASHRSYSVDSRKSVGIFNSVFADLFGRKRVETADVMFDNQTEEIFSWDDVGGEFRDIISRGFFSMLTQAMLEEMDQKRQKFVDDGVTSVHRTTKEWRELEKRKGQGIWSTSNGPLGLCFGACKIRDVEAAMLEVPPVFFSSRLGNMGSETRLIKGFILVSVNNESTFGKSFISVMKLLANAPRPSSLCFRWYKDYSPFLETELFEQDHDSDHRRRSGKHDPTRTFEYGLDCLSEAQTDLCNTLHLALVENASIRNEIGMMEDTHREVRMKYDQVEKKQAELEAQLKEREERIAQLEQELAKRQLELDQSRAHYKAGKVKLANSKLEFQKQLEAAHASAVERIAEHESRLIKESNKSIENAKMIAERKTQQALDTAIGEMQRKHNEYLQKLADEHSEEVDSLMQQVAVWRHQVEVLTEAEKRNYASMINNGRHEFQRSRFGYADSPFSSSSAGGSARTLGGRNYGHYNTKDDDAWRDGSPAGSEDGHAFTDRSDGSSLSNNGNGTFWDRVVSLIVD